MELLVSLKLSECRHHLGGGTKKSTKKCTLILFISSIRNELKSTFEVKNNVTIKNTFIEYFTF